MKNIVLLFAVAFLAFACEKNEVPVKPASSQAAVAGMGNDYKTMLYYNVNSGEFVREVSHIEYDLQFPSQPDNQHIFLNSANFMEAKNAGVVPFESITDTLAGVAWRYDFPTGDLDRTAIGEWYDADGNSKNEVFVLNRGYNELGNSLGFMKMMVMGATDKNFTIRFAELDNTGDTTVTIQKNLDKERVQFWLTTAAESDIEPIANNWNLRFTQYTDYDLTDEGDTLKYIVRGVLINQTNTTAAKLLDTDFDQVTRVDAQNTTLKTDRNAIGYNWKFFNFDTGSYEIVPNIVYIIKDISGNYYKLRFLDYYNDAGEKGYARFEIIGL